MRLGYLYRFYLVLFSSYRNKRRERTRGGREGNQKETPKGFDNQMSFLPTSRVKYQINLSK